MQKAQLTLFLFFMRFAQKTALTLMSLTQNNTHTLMVITQNNYSYVHGSHAKQLRLHSHHLHTKQNSARTHVAHSTYTLPISLPIIALKRYKTKRFYGKIARFSIVFTHKQQPNKPGAMPYIVRNHTEITRQHTQQNTRQKHIQTPQLYRKTYYNRAPRSKS